jgi:hypothetical protein
MTKGTDNKDEFDFSEFDEMDANKEKDVNASLNENKDDLDDLFSGDFDFSDDNSSTHEDIPTLTDIVDKKDVSPVNNTTDDFDDFDFGELENPTQETKLSDAEHVVADDFDFSELESSDDFTEVNNESVSTDDFDFDELDNMASVKDKETSPVEDDFNFDELEDVSALSDTMTDNIKPEDEFNFDELDTLPSIKDEKDTLADDFDFAELDNDPTVDPDMVFNEPEATKELSDAVQDDFNTDFDFNETDMSADQKITDFSADFDFEETVADSSFKENNENVSVSNDDFDFDDDVLSKDFNNEETLVDATDLNDDFNFDEVDLPFVDPLIDDDNKDFEEILDNDSNPLKLGDEPVIAASDLDTTNFDFDFDDEIDSKKVDESKDIVNNDIYNNNGDEGMSERKDTNDFDFENTDEFDFGEEVSAKKDNNKDDDFNDFDFGNDAGNSKQEEFDTSFNMEDKDEFDFGSPKDDNEHEADFALNSNSQEDQEEDAAPVTKSGKKGRDSEPKEKKATSPVFKYTILALAVALIGGAGFIGYTKFFPTYEEDEETPAQQAAAPVQKQKEVKQAPKVEKPKKEVTASDDLSDLDTLANDQPVAKQKVVVPEAVSVPVSAPVNNNFNSDQSKDYEKLQNQFAQVIGSVSKMSNEIESLKSENQRMQGLLNKVKSEGNNADFENFQLDFSGLKTEVGNLKKQVTADKDFSKETMIKFLTISKKLKEEVSNLKNSQVNKGEIDAKLNEINELSKQVELLNTKVANNEVMSKIATLEKNLNDKKLLEVESKVNKTEKAQTSSSNKQKSVLELLEEKNKEKSMEKNTVVVDEDDEDLKVPLSVTIEEDSEESPKPVVKKQTVKKKTNHEYFFIGTIEGVVYLKSASGSISEYRVNEQLPGYGEILKIYKDGSIETENGNVKFKEK